MPKSWGIALALALLASLAAGGWLLLENQRLEGELQRKPVAAAPAPDPDPRARGDSVMSTLGRVLDRVESTPEPSAVPGADAGPVDWEARRERRQRRIRDFLGRRPGESEQAYRERVMPLLTAGLSTWRDRASERRKEYEEEAGITAEQSKKMDEVFADAYSEVVAAANESIARGEISPYRRSTRGILSFVGGTVAILDSVDSRLQQILTAEQITAGDAMGFDLVEYLAITAPWETLSPPPPE
jgi:hypothetical protein